MIISLDAFFALCAITAYGVAVHLLKVEFGAKWEQFGSLGYLFDPTALSSRHAVEFIQKGVWRSEGSIQLKLCCAAFEVFKIMTVAFLVASFFV